MQCEIQLLRVGGRSVLFFKCLLYAFQEISCTISSLCLPRLILCFPASSSHDFFRDWQGGSGDKEGCAVPLTPPSFHPGHDTQDRGSRSKTEPHAKTTGLFFSLLLPVNLQFFLFVQSLGTNAADVWLAHAWATPYMKNSCIFCSCCLC